ncbi:hypothetical protein Taro_049212, partial [Colocasia esculenta]|nr:hypothetical protein [Colocasia esculenta]
MFTSTLFQHGLHFHIDYGYNIDFISTSTLSEHRLSLNINSLLITIMVLTSVEYSYLNSFQTILNYILHDIQIYFQISVDFKSPHESCCIMCSLTFIVSGSSRNARCKVGIVNLTEARRDSDNLPLCKCLFQHLMAAGSLAPYFGPDTPTCMKM